MNRSFQVLPVPDISESNLNHSFKFNQPDDHRKIKKPPKLYPKKETSFSRHLLDHEVHVISFKENDSNISILPSPRLSLFEKSSPGVSLYDKNKSNSYYEQCFDQLCKLGEGSFGEVFKVKSKSDGKTYAVKKTKQLSRSENHRRERLEEVKRYEEFSNDEHCIKFYKAWEQDDLLYIQIELCKGSVEDYVTEIKKTPEDFVWSFLLDMLLALKSLHERNLVHLDVKLDNILITESKVCKLADFGLVFDLLNSPRSRAIEGDSRYLAPELLQGNYALSNDVFSLGITLLELSSNLELPSNGQLWQELRSAKFPESAMKSLSKDLQSIIKMMMEPDPNKRPTVHELLRNPVLKKLQIKRKLKKTFEGMNKKIVDSFRFAYRTLLATMLMVFNFFKLDNKLTAETNYQFARVNHENLNHDNSDIQYTERGSSLDCSSSSRNLMQKDDDNNNESSITPTLNNSIPRVSPDFMTNSTPLNHYCNSDGTSNRKFRRDLTKSSFLTSSPFLSTSSRSISQDKDSFICKKLCFQDDDSEGI